MAETSAHTNGSGPQETILQTDKKRETAGRIAADIARSLAIYTHASRDAFIIGLKIEKV